MDKYTRKVYSRIEDYLKLQFGNKSISRLSVKPKSKKGWEPYGYMGKVIMVSETDKTIYYYLE